MTTDRLRVATLNIRNLADRWWERLPLLLADFAALQPDLMGLQEVVYPLQQDRVIAAGGEGRYVARRGWAGRPEYGNAILIAERLAGGLGAETIDDRLDLGLTRCAHRVDLRTPGGTRLRFVNVHLHHVVPDEAARDEQVARLLGWLHELPQAAATLVCGDFNAEPVEPAYARMCEAGFRSAFLEATAAEPAVTWPSGLVAPAMDTDGDPGCLDYIWLRGAVRASGARLVFDRPAADDGTLYPSDHVGLLVEVEVGA